MYNFLSIYLKIMDNIGFIYVRQNEYLSTYDACKLGKTTNLLERDSQYKTLEIKRGTFTNVFKMSKYDSDTSEKILQNYFNSIGYHIYYNGGIEFYKRDIICLISPYLQDNNIEFQELTEKEINEQLLERPERDKNEDENKDENEDEDENKSNNDDEYENEDESNDESNSDDEYENEDYKIVPKSYQEKIISKSIEYFTENDKGIISVTCGAGKTFISLWISNQLNCNKILVCVPNIDLLHQWKKAIIYLFGYRYQIFVISQKLNIKKVIECDKFIIITTYASVHKLSTLDFTFDMKILDECHHVTSKTIEKSERKQYIKSLDISSKKQLALTATMKIIESNNEVVSNDNISQFGKVIDTLTLMDGIKLNIICDYDIITILTNDDKLEEILSSLDVKFKYKRLFLSAYTALRSIYEGHVHHLLIYANNTKNTKKIKRFIRLLIKKGYFNIPSLYYSEYNGNMSKSEKSSTISKFETSELGIITCVYCLSEGYDFKALSGVVISENMTSEIRIVQAILRANRKYEIEPEKRAKILIPMLDNDDWSDNKKQDYSGVRRIIDELSKEDTMVHQKVRAYVMDIEKKEKKETKKEKEDENVLIGKYDEELTNALKLKTTKRIALGITYEKAKKIVGIYKLKSRDEYYTICNNDYRLYPNPEEIYRNKFKGWNDYLSIEKACYNLDECKQKVIEYIDRYPELKNHKFQLSEIAKELCKIDDNFPLYGLWCDYYKVSNLESIIKIDEEDD